MILNQSKRLRALLERPGILVLPGVYDCLGAKLCEQCGFEVAFTSGFGISASTLGKPDYGFLTASEMLYAVGRIVDATRLPVVADIDTGYGNPLNVMRTVQELVRLGAAGIILEDQEWPKRCGHFEGKRVISMEEHVEKIRAAVEARGDSGLVIIGRTDARASLGLEEAIRRGRRYFESGADIIFIEAPQSREELETISDSLPEAPLFANMIEGGRTPLLTSEDLEQLGFKIVVFPLSGLFAATRAQALCLRHLREKGTTAGFGQLLSFAEFEPIVEVDRFRELESRFAAKQRREG